MNFQNTRFYELGGHLSRRTFVKGLAVGTAAASLGIAPGATWAQRSSREPTSELSGSDFDLNINETSVNFTGARRTALTVNHCLPAPTLRWRQGDTVTLRVSNMTTAEDTSLHWHGILLPANMDGVPGLSFHGIPPGGSYLYRFNVRQAGTYWYHSHSGFQEQRGLYGALIIDPIERPPFQYDREHDVLLSDWTDEDPRRVFAKLKKQSDYYNFKQRTVGDFFRDIRNQGLGATLSDRLMWGDMRMKPTDLADVSGYTYTYLTNGIAPAGNWTGLFKPGERVLLRFINGSSMTYFDVRIPGLKLTVVAVDGQYVHPVTVDEFRMAVAETFDVIVEPSGQDAFTIFAQSMDRTGYAKGTLATRAGLKAEVPDVDSRRLLTMADMGHGSHASTASDPHAGHNVGAQNAADPHAGHNVPAPQPADPYAGHNVPAADQADPHAGHNMSGTTAPLQEHPASEKGNPLVDMQAMMPASRLDDPGVGLRGGSRKVLTYADLKSLFDDPDGREPSRAIELHLTGHMEKFAWSFDGLKFSSAEPIVLKYGERLRITLVNDTMMTHPIHLHGMWSDIEDDSGAFHLRKHTVDMPPGTKRSYRVRADALGRWAYHCHLLLHMEAGMMREVRVVE